MQIKLDELDAATVKAALGFLREAMDADEEKRPQLPFWHYTDESLGCHTPEDVLALRERIAGPEA